jgi:ABC-type multidrug transport system ATPase subunit
VRDGAIFGLLGPNGAGKTTDAARSLALTGTLSSLAGALAWIGGILLVFVPLSVRRYRRMG